VETLEAFFNWKIQSIVNAGLKQRWQHAGLVVINQAWIVDFLQQCTTGPQRRTRQPWTQVETVWFRSASSFHIYNKGEQGSTPSPFQGL
jgi:hypothetical protein